MPDITLNFTDELTTEDLRDLVEAERTAQKPLAQLLKEAAKTVAITYRQKRALVSHGAARAEAASAS